MSVGFGSVSAMRERILAAMGAVALIAAALVARSLIVGDGPTSHEPGRSGDRPVVACTPDLAEVCSALVADGAIRPAARPLELAGAAAPDDELDGWITWGAAPGVANFDAPGTWTVPSEVVASAPLGVLVAGGVVGCADGDDWASCVVEGADGGFAVGIGSGTTAQGLARLDPVARALVPADGDFTTIPAAALRRIITSPQVAQSDFADQITTFLTRRGALAMVVGPTPELQEAATRGSTSSVVVPVPRATLTVVLATRASAGAEPLPASAVLSSRRASDALTDLGMTPGTGPAPPESLAGELYAIYDKIR